MYVLSLFALAALASATEFTTRHELREVPTGWTPIARAPAEHLIDMKIGLKQARMTELLATLHEISDPANARYGKHLSKDEVDALVAPRSETVKTVEKWLDSHGVKVTGRSLSGDWVHVTVPVSRAEKMLNTRYNVYRHTSGNHIVRSESYALPRSLDTHVDLIQPTTFFGKIHEGGLQKRASTSFIMPSTGKPVEDAVGPKEAAAVPSSCASTITPSCLRTLYNTASYTPKATTKNSLGITGYLNQYASTSDLATFYSKYQSASSGKTFTVELINGGKNTQSNPGIEANLDVQYGGAVSYGTPNIFYSTGGSPPYKPDSNTPTNTNEPYLDWVSYMLNKTTLPYTISTSYGDDEQTVPLDYATRVCNDFATLGARGVSILFSSGDGGVGSGTCKTNDGSNRTRFQPIFPASCPYVTAVGGTYKVSPEVGVSFSQGGFSDYFARPSWQSTAVSGFLSSLGSTYNGLYNTTGRGFPDVAAQGQGFQVVLSGRTTSVGGTSASCPTFAGVVALLNDYRISNGKSSLGWLNPWLYANATSALNDITSGSNPGCGTNGFTARAGWDPVTGLGTPDFVKLQAVV
ncbi:tripeptidyl-peptidase I [Ceratobasidium sp. AG-Ba]|nr:tripeptidyl-peptidase I [Ceratobasidium sp. AG-Ba]